MSKTKNKFPEPSPTDSHQNRFADSNKFRHLRLPTSSSNSLGSNALMLSASSSTNHSGHSFDRHGDTGRSKHSTDSFDFLPSVSFDDLHTSIESASTDFKLTQFPLPPGDGSSFLDSDDLMEKRVPVKSTMPQNTTTPRGGSGTIPPPAPANRTTRSGSILKQPGTSSRQASVSSIVSSSSGTFDPSAAPASARNRRQSHYPPVSGAMASKQPRKSIGPGVVVADTEAGPRNIHARRSSLLSDKRGSRVSAKGSVDGTMSGDSDSGRNLPGTRAAKAKSIQPAVRGSQANFLGASDRTPDQARLSTLAPRSPRLGSKQGTPSSGSSKRVSMMPGSHSSSHATGLGARTISPTDTRRMKRLSTMPQSQSMNMLANVPPPPPPISLKTRDESRSPSMIPRKPSLTPSSARTTPDISNRKSYNSGLSMGSAHNFNALRTSTGSAQARVPPPSSSSRLPSLKGSSTHGSGANNNNSSSNNNTSSTVDDDEEDVPPVPAIPKVYESPKDSPADTYFMEKKKTGLSAVESTSIHHNPTGSISMPVHPEPTKAQQSISINKNLFAPTTANEGQKETGSIRKQLEPLQLPPLNLGPINFPTSNSKGGSQGVSQRDLRSPPLSRQLPKTPTTPMTASKSSFFSKGHYDDTIELPPLRSSTSAHHIRQVTPTPPDGNTSESSLSGSEPNHKSSISPFLSSSLPKSGFAAGHLKRPKTGGDFPTVTGNFFGEPPVPNKPSGPRNFNKDKPVPKSPPPEPEEHDASTQDLRSPSSKTSLRRKLSLSWKRASSKTGVVAPLDISGKPTATQQGISDSMPPPRLPASATVNSLMNLKQSNPSTVIQPNPSGDIGKSRRRQSSAASMTGYSTRDRVKSESWNMRNDSHDSNTMPSIRSNAVPTKPPKAKSSSSALRAAGSWTSELDKDDLAAEEEMRKLGSRRKETEIAGRALDALKKRASPKERVSPQDAIRIAMLNIYERGEIIDYNDVYFCGTQNARKIVGDLQSDSPNFGYDDERGDYTIVPGDHLSYRYEIVDILGKGSFGQVVRCIDHKFGVLVAVKIIRNKKRFHQQALVEVNILQKLREWDPKNKHSMVNFTQSFYFRGHLCISTELLDMNLYEFIKAHSFRGFSLRIIRRFTKQMLGSLVLLKQRKVIHCDLKPENILLRHPMHSEIKVIDFGSSCFEHEKVYTYIQSRFYRSPEVILGMTYGMPIDMWSVGCILAELYTGVPIFPGENEQEQLACIMEVFGPPEKHLIEKSTRKKLFFDSQGKPRLTVSSKGRRRRPSSKTLQQTLKCDDDAFLDFIARCLRWDPERRLRPEDAIKHEFITGQKPVLAPLPRLPTRESSPVRRNNTISTPRPLPDPPGALGKGTINTVRTGMSPQKPPISAGSRRTSAMGATAASINRRTSAGGSISSISGLPRVAGRTASGKQDLAAAGASAAMRRA